MLLCQSSHKTPIFFIVASDQSLSVKLCPSEVLIFSNFYSFRILFEVESLAIQLKMNFLEIFEKIYKMRDF